MKTFKRMMVMVSVTAASSSVLAAQLPESWMVSETGGRSMGVREASTLDKEATREVDELFEANQDAVEDIALGRRNRTDVDKWHLEFFTADLGVTAGGTLGVLAFKGTPAVQVYWRRRDTSARSEQPAGETASGDGAMEVTSESTLPEIEGQAGAIARALERSGRIRDASVMTGALTRVSTQLQAMMSAMPENPGFEWWLSTLRLDVSVDASGQVYPGVKVGAAARVRLNWSRLMRKKPASNRVLAAHGMDGVNAESLRGLVASVSEELDRASRDEKMEKHGFEANALRLGVGVSAGGDIGIVKAGASVTGHLIFSRQKKKKPSRTLVASSEAPVLLIHQGPRGLDGKLIDRSIFRKGIEKSLKMGRFFAKRAEKANRKNRKSKWAVYQIKTSFDMSAGGDVGVAKLTGLVTSELAFKNTAF